MMTPEGAGEYEPDQSELRRVFDDLQWALESNPRLTVSTNVIVDNGLRRIFRHYSFAGPAVRGTLPVEDDYDEIAVETRINTTKRPDIDWAKVELRNQADVERKFHRGTEYVLHRDVSYAEVSAGQPYFRITKWLPSFDADEAGYRVVEDLPAEEEEFAMYIEDTVRSITPDDVRLLGHIARALCE